MKVHSDQALKTKPLEDLIHHYRIVRGTQGITAVTYCGERVENDASDSLVQSAFLQIDAYLRQVRTTLDFPVEIKGTPFQKSVYEAVMKIPYGDVWTYKEVAEAIGKPNAQRAVGGALNKNPLSLVVPCHRVVGSDGKLVGFGSGLSVKKTLLKLEGSL